MKIQLYVLDILLSLVEVSSELNILLVTLLYLLIW